ncbi:hypothetical protein K505DRAFT_372636 [Melanomma pulvis-pyrius CBS 109.77]|uniref:Uncharacterized protein n=1 Tax=Melanomma pulvis-pyrius CBS 109.77 TaxID=1314802 RepID=A0A6A6XMM2_9PLEO|nr:hypothetical protein K505DRAFT_372636 [Melanomma pulvis-pyrius CBS 109.77]
MSDLLHKLPPCEISTSCLSYDKCPMSHYHVPLQSPRPQRRTYTHICLPLVILSSILTFSWVLVDLFQTTPRHAGIVHTAEVTSNETCHWCIIEVGEEQKQWPAVGYDLTESYGTATIKFPSGEIIYIGPIEGDDNYKNAMHKLSLESSKHTAPPYNWYWDAPGGPFAGTYDYPRRQWRSWRKYWGLPATHEVGAISTLLTSLIASSSAAILARNSSQDATKAVITTPDLLALYDEDIYDVAEYAGLNASGAHPFRASYFPDTVLSTPRYERQPKYIDAAYMGYGFGLCSPYQSDNNCQTNDTGMRYSNVLTVYISRRAVDIEHGSWKNYAYTRMLDYQQHASFFDDTLGLDDRTSGNEDGGEDEAAYWQRLRALLLSCMHPMSSQNNVSHVFLVGEKAKEERVEMEVREAISQRPQVYVPRVYKENAVFGPSRGAAEMAARILWFPEDCGFDEPVKGRKLCRKD